MNLNDKLNSIDQNREETFAEIAKHQRSAENEIAEVVHTAIKIFHEQTGLHVTRVSVNLDIALNANGGITASDVNGVTTSWDRAGR